MISSRLSFAIWIVFVKGIRPREIAQYMAKAWGPSGGKDPQSSISVMDKGFHWADFAPADMIPVMTGILLKRACSERYCRTAAYIGDGGSSTGAFYEGMNFAAVQKLPLVVIVENQSLRLF
jgi:pyruvate dehydrogenase E1 component alpha subunit/2-oxoisovalerate dehydrogenase E1 component alpha subunit